MYYDLQPVEKQEEYKRLLQNIGQLSRMYSESDDPYLYYRAHEKLFSRVFPVEDNSRHDDSVDAYDSGIHCGIGLKTWVGSDMQKVAEFGRLLPQYAGMTGLSLVSRIAEFRNNRVQTTMNLHKLSSMVYHIVKRTSGAMEIYEDDYELIDIPNIRLLKKGNQNSTYFTDGRSEYKFSNSKNTLYKDFSNKRLLDRVEVTILEEPFTFIEEVLATNSEDVARKGTSGRVDIAFPPAVTKEKLCLRLYSTKDKGKTKFVPLKSGLNQWNAGGRKRKPNEVYIPYPKKDRERGKFFPPRDHHFTLELPDKRKIKAKVCQADSKAIMSSPNSDLGEWLLRSVFDLAERELITYEMLESFGIDSVVFTKEHEDYYSVDFSQLGTYEEFYGIDDPDN